MTYQQSIAEQQAIAEQRNYIARIHKRRQKAEETGDTDLAANLWQAAQRKEAELSRMVAN